MVQLLADVFIMLGCFALAVEIYETNGLNNDAMLAAYLLLPLFQTIAFYNATYSRGGLTEWRKSSARAIGAMLISALLLNFFAFFAKMNAEFSRVVFAAGMMLTAIGMTAFRYGVSRWITSRWGPSATNRLLIEAGGPQVNIPHLYRVRADEHGLSPDITDPVALDRLAKYLQNMDEVIVSCKISERLGWAEVLKGSGIHGEVISEFAREIGALGVIHHDQAQVSALLVSSGHLGLRSRATKRAFDVISSLLGLILLSPLMLLCALAIKLEDGGPVFFMQRRMGRGNQFFDIFKFRSMREAKADADGALSASRDDDRVTRIGRIMRRTSLDELPQLINVLRGDMSIVGPRPHALGSLAGKKMFWQVDRKYWQRHSLRPGITGLAQVRGFRGATDREVDLANRLQADLEYMNSWSLWGDVKIVLSTLSVLVHHRAF
ncbi:exopolysaccharide biosynthesis polyprenyl glycosylphosphotransferase [Alteraurantiacibacter aestuarii]|uniref:Exopolysaccharide biosynthesis polyprenyl glycosylphosphotransferase n=1 Tax=Alteraurantiacibacter aestuarii TaxID=650004 RepID=A0A844ZN41_9SPHN|nr:exopolysaccharide biosynthesis polyprenyl glycosylphosphotransferase [Alteraurantiacibacter aestuarii]MXO88450.1 exopolysaccharide biosynthesis polyprenyl glycosylphosphotransferase [Alteraurantiacibacter aestuarii]